MNKIQAEEVAHQLARGKTPIYTVIAPYLLGVETEEALANFDAICAASKPPRVKIAKHRNDKGRAFAYALMYPQDPVAVQASAAARFMSLPRETLPGYQHDDIRPSGPQVLSALLRGQTQTTLPRNPPGKYDLSDGSRITIKSAAVEGAEEICAMLRLIPRDEADARIAADRASTITEVTTL